MSVAKVNSQLKKKKCCELESKGVRMHDVVKLETYKTLNENKSSIFLLLKKK